ncbi:MAG: SCP2 sterol-binding domain-containing protein [Alphaproteobacteria bacterium]|nr:SCP2 sterol-binding domain-containing protein [Alphaproteobacteria bacterium]
MPQEGLPVPLAKGAMRILPPRLLAHLIGVLMQRIKRRHPQVFRNLARLDKAVVHVELTDVPHRFALTLGVPEPELALIEGAAEKPDATIGGSLENLLDMLEGRSDGDTLFFARGITVTGDTSVIVALRNTLDREEINLLDDVMSFCGPFALPATKAVSLLDRLARKARERITALHDEVS